MKLKDLRKKNISELHKDLHSLLREQCNLRIQKGTGETPRTHSFREVRINIARVKTLINEKIKAKESYE